LARFDTSPVEVNIGPCGCPNAPHADGDIVYLAPELSMPGGMAAQSAISEGITDPLRLQELLAEVWVRHGVIDWNLVDEDGDKLPLDAATIKAALPYGKGGRLVAERADDLYAEAILAPLEERLRNSSRRGPTVVSSSTTPRSTRSRRRPSSTATSAGKARPAA
jgi:hypothetical protein